VNEEKADLRLDLPQGTVFILIFIQEHTLILEILMTSFFLEIVLMAISSLTVKA